MTQQPLDIEPVITRMIQYGNKEMAQEVIECFAEDASSFHELENMAKVYVRIGEPEKAIPFAEKAIEKCENQEYKLAIKKNMVSVYRSCAFPEKALAIVNELGCEKDIFLKIEKAGCLYELNKRKESQEILNSISVSSNTPDYFKMKIASQQGCLNLWSGNFQQGLRQAIIAGSTVREMESSVPDLFHSRKEINLPFWEGSSDCKNLIIYAEAGVGDEIINIRFMKNLKEKGINAVWYGPWHENAVLNKRLGVAEVFRNSGFNVVTNLNQIRNIQEYMWTYSQYLPINLGVSEKELWTGPYLKASSKFDRNDNKKIGIRWYGNPVPKFRNYPLKQLYSVLKNVYAEFYSLQKDVGMEELVDFPEIIDLSDKIDSFEDTVNYINNMDIIITSCTSIAHASAALGKKTYVFVPISAYYTWCHPTEKSPWYGDNVTLLRQKKPRVWDEPMEELKNLLREKNLINE